MQRLPSANFARSLVVTQSTMLQNRDKILVMMNVFNYLVLNKSKLFIVLFSPIFNLGVSTVQCWVLKFKPDVQFCLLTTTWVQFSSTYVHTEATPITWWSTESAWNSLFLQKHLINFYLCKSLTELLNDSWIMANFWVSEYICASIRTKKNYMKATPKIVC